MNNKGLTLIEIIISIGILAIVALLFMNIFAKSHILITDAGDDSKGLIDNQGSIESMISEDNIGVALTMEIYFPGHTKQLSVDGVSIIEGTFTSFLPGIDSDVSDYGSTLKSIVVILSDGSYGILNPGFSPGKTDYVVDDVGNSLPTVTFELFDPVNVSVSEIAATKKDPIHKIIVTYTNPETSEVTETTYRIVFNK